MVFHFSPFAGRIVFYIIWNIDIISIVGVIQIYQMLMFHSCPRLFVNGHLNLSLSVAHQALLVGFEAYPAVLETHTTPSTFLGHVPAICLKISTRGSLLYAPYMSSIWQTF